MLDNPEAHKLIATYKHWGQPIPAGLIAPKIHDIEFNFWRAFWNLSTDRRGGDYPGPIPWSSIKSYAQGMRGVDQEVFTQIIREMDDVYLQHKPPKAKASR